MTGRRTGTFRAGAERLCVPFADMVASWDVAQDVRPLDLRALFQLERHELVALLSRLTDEEWHARAIGSWAVHAVTLHLFGNDFDRAGEAGTGLDLDYRSLAEIIERENDEWVEATRAIPMTLIPELLLASGSHLVDQLEKVDLHKPATNVGWSGSGPSPAWLHIAREYTERWVHHQQIREAVGRPGLNDRQWTHPVFDTFMLALPRAYESVEAPQGTTVRVVVSGPSGGVWCIRRGSPLAAGRGDWIHQRRGAAPGRARLATLRPDGVPRGGDAGHRATGQLQSHRTCMSCRCDYDDLSLSASDHRGPLLGPVTSARTRC